MSITNLTLNNGVELPAIGFGVFQSAPDETAAAVTEALRVGYRHIDTAAAYGNEREVGQAIAASGLPRDEIFIETKIWISDYGYDETLHGFEKSAAKLGVEQIDLLILHQPLPTAWEKTLGAYRALERLLADGKVRAIGVSNFMPDHLASLLEATDVVPAVNQIELHPTWQQREVVAYCKEHGIAVEAYSPMARGADLNAGDGVIARIAEAHGVTPAQVILRWHIENGTIIIPKSVHADRQKQNLDLFGFVLSPAEHAAIDALDGPTRAGHDPMTFTYA